MSFCDARRKPTNFRHALIKYASSASLPTVHHACSLHRARGFDLEVDVSKQHQLVGLSTHQRTLCCFLYQFFSLMPSTHFFILLATASFSFLRVGHYLALQHRSLRTGGEKTLERRQRCFFTQRLMTGSTLSRNAGDLKHGKNIGSLRTKKKTFYEQLRD